MPVINIEIYILIQFYTLVDKNLSQIDIHVYKKTISKINWHRKQQALVTKKERKACKLTYHICVDLYKKKKMSKIK